VRFWVKKERMTAGRKREPHWVEKGKHTIAQQLTLVRTGKVLETIVRGRAKGTLW